MSEQEPVNIFDFEKLAESRLGAMLDYYVGGAQTKSRCARPSCLRAHRAVVPRAGQCRRARAETTVLGERVSMPILIAPTAFHRMAHPEGELATARGREGEHHHDCQHARTRAWKTIASAATGPLWFQPISTATAKPRAIW
jgi:4-hydroxymandelate oxidase